MQKFVMSALLAGAMTAGLSMARAEDAQPADVVTDVTAVEVVPSMEMPVPGMSVEEVVVIDETPADVADAPEPLPVELVDPPQDTVVDVDGTDADKGEALPDEGVVIMPPENPEDGMMYITGAPVGLEATSGLADVPAATSEPRVGLDDAAASEMPAAAFPAPMDVIDADPAPARRAVSR